MAVGVVDALEIVDVEDDGRELAGRDGALASLVGLLEETAPVGKAGERVGGGEADEVALHRGDALGGAEPRIELLGERRLGDEIVGAGIERLDQAAMAAFRGHIEDIDRAPAGGEQTRLPAQLQPRHGGELVAGDQRLDQRVQLNPRQGRILVGEGQDVMAARFEKLGNSRAGGTARVNESDSHERSLGLVFKRLAHSS